MNEMTQLKQAINKDGEQSRQVMEHIFTTGKFNEKTSSARPSEEYN